MLFWNNMYYTIYKTTNLINGKIYIGKHKTTNLDDMYIGSGKILKHAIKKHGINNFIKEYLFIFDNEEDMNNKELELVSEEFIKEDTNYNLKVGGEGGWDYVNTSGLRGVFGKHSESTCKQLSESTKRFLSIKENRENNLEKLKRMRVNSIKNNPNGTFYGKSHTEETKEKMRKPKNIGKENPQYGTIWIYSLEEKVSKRINKNDAIPDGWYKGRKIKFTE